MRPRLQVKRCGGAQLRRLRRMYDRAAGARVRRRLQTILLAQQGYATHEIARVTRQSQMNVRRGIHRFGQHGCDGLLEMERSGRPADITPAIENFLRTVVGQLPRRYGYRHAGWTTHLLAKLIGGRFKRRVTGECIRQHLKRAGIVCRRPTWTVKHKAQAQPGYAQKRLDYKGITASTARDGCVC